jgi:hypothetical protein
MPAAVILADNTIAAVLMADATIDPPPADLPADAKWLNAPAGCHENWTYHPATGFAPPAVQDNGPPLRPAAPANRVEF